MASKWGKLKYDECNYDQEIKITTFPGMYSVNLDTYENNIGSTNDAICCDPDVMKRIDCDSCDVNREATINNNHKDYADKRVDIDSDLKIYNIVASKCVESKYKPQNNNCAQNIFECQHNKVVVNPILCDRSIVPTNMKPPTSSGLCYNL